MDIDFSQNERSGKLALGEITRIAGSKTSCSLNRKYVYTQHLLRGVIVSALSTRMPLIKHKLLFDTQFIMVIAMTDRS